MARRDQQVAVEAGPRASAHYERGDIAPLLKSRKRLQSNLGEVNDLDVQQRTLQRFAPQMEAQELAPVRCQLAIAHLLDNLRRQQGNERRRFATSFDRFSAGDIRALIRATVQAAATGRACPSLDVLRDHREVIRRLLIHINAADIRKTSK